VIKKLLIANRGEIVIRIVRSCRELGIATVGVYSEADAGAAHVRAVDQAFLIGAAAPSSSYLNAERVIAVAKESGADAVHPGYGFFSENAAFAQMVIDAGLIWVGPTPELIALMGDKIAARKAARENGFPVIPGTHEPSSDPEELIAVAEKLGFPVLLKAAAGGGGKGIRMVREAGELASELERAQSEARKFFANDAIYLEKAVVDARHIEVQVLGHKDGAIHLFERECSLQRRHQKLLEESPATAISPLVRERLTSAAVRLTAGIGYQGAGTIECLYSADGSFYFLEMNTRLQVEHPVTEMVLGVDLVAEQLRVASGLPPSIAQEDLRQRGHAIEMRVYAEDPARNFAPSTGQLDCVRWPSGPFVRVDSGVESGDEVSLYYDPMLAKLIVWGEDRERALARLQRAEKECLIAGLQTSLSLVPALCADDEFCRGEFHTNWLDGFVARLPGPSDEEITDAAIAAVLAAHGSQTARTTASPGGPVEAWKMSGRPGFPSRF